MKKKKSYTEPELEVVLFDKLDIITSSSGNTPGGSTDSGWGSSGELDPDAWD